MNQNKTIFFYLFFFLSAIRIFSQIISADDIESVEIQWLISSKLSGDEVSFTNDHQVFISKLTDIINNSNLDDRGPVFDRTFEGQYYIKFHRINHEDITVQIIGDGSQFSIMGEEEKVWENSYFYVFVKHVLYQYLYFNNYTFHITK